MDSLRLIETLSSPFPGPRTSTWVSEGDLKNAPTAGIEPMTSRSLGRHHIHYTTATLVPSIICLHLLVLGSFYNLFTPVGTWFLL